MWVVTNIEEDGRLARQHLKTARQFDVRQTQTDVLRGNRQTVPQSLEARQRGGGIDELIRAAQRRAGERRAAQRAAHIAPLLTLAAGLAFIAKIAAEEPQIGADR